MINTYEEFVKYHEQAKKLGKEYDRDSALCYIPGILLPGPGTIISCILIDKRFEKFKRDLKNLK